MKRTIDVTITLIESDGTAEVAFYDNGTSYRYSMQIQKTDDETAKEIGWEILSWVDMMRYTLANRDGTNKEAAT